MSSWGHIAGGVMIDNFGKIRGTTINQQKEDLERVIGPISTYEDQVETCLPDGSEGSLEYTIHIQEDTEDNIISVSNTSVSFYGNIRDFDESDINGVDKWLNDSLGQEKLSEIGMGVRTGCLTVDINHNKNITFIWDVQNNLWKRIN